MSSGTLAMKVLTYLTVMSAEYLFPSTNINFVSETWYILIFITHCACTDVWKYIYVSDSSHNEWATTSVDCQEKI